MHKKKKNGKMKPCLFAVVEHENIVCLDKVVNHDVIIFSGSQLEPVA